MTTTEKIEIPDDALAEVTRAATSITDAQNKDEQAEYALKRTDEWAQWERAMVELRARQDDLRAIMTGRAPVASMPPAPVTGGLSARVIAVLDSSPRRTWSVGDVAAALGEPR